MLSVNRHPILKRIRMQLLIESIAWILFLAFYYDFFDGHLKPVLWNLALVFSAGLILVHNLLGYQVTNNPIHGSNLVNSLEIYLQKLKKYALVSISSRVLAISIVCGFFLSGLENLAPRHFMGIVVFAIIITIQAVILRRVWSKRIQTISSKYQQLITTSDEI